MNENEKIERIKKSCKYGKIVSNIIFIIFVVLAVCAAVGSGVIFNMGKDYDQMVEKYIEEGKVFTEDSVGSVRVFNINVGNPSNMTSDSEFIQKALDDHPYCVTNGLYCIIFSAIMIVIAVTVKLISSVFDLIEKEDNPFTDNVIKRVTVVMGVSSAMLFFTTGLLFGIIGAITTWVVYMIMDYGRMLQIQADETL